MLMNVAMVLEREQYLKTKPYERTEAERPFLIYTFASYAIILWLYLYAWRDNE